MIEINDNARITINGKESRLGDLIPFSNEIPNKARDSACEPILNVVGTVVDTGPCKGVIGLGPDIQRSPTIEEGMLQPVEPNLVGFSNFSVDGVGSPMVGLDLNLKDVEVSQSYGEKDLGFSLLGSTIPRCRALLLAKLRGVRRERGF